MTNPVSKPTDQPAQDKDIAQNVLVGGITEIMFVGLPLLVLTIVLIYKGQTAEILASPEWSFAAAVLFGQGVVKLVGTLSEKGGMHGERVALLCTIILVLGLVPSLVVLSLILLSDHPVPWLIDLQIVLIIFALVSFLFCTDMVSSARAERGKSH